METSNYGDEFKRGAAHQITVRGYPVREVSRRLKRGRIRRRTHPTRDAARPDMFEYIELFFNPKRKHTNNGVLSPVEFEIREQKLTEAGVQETRGASDAACLPGGFVAGNRPPVSRLAAGPRNCRTIQITIKNRVFQVEWLAGAAGFEPANGGTKSRCLTTWRRPKTKPISNQEAGVAQAAQSEIPALRRPRPGSIRLAGSECSSAW